LKWHRRLAAKRWTKDKPLGRRPVSREIRKLVIEVKNKNRFWGPKRIHGEMIKLRIEVSESSIRNILRRAKFDPLGPPQKESWREFIARHKTVWAMDYFTVHSATFKRLFVLVMMDINTRELICTRVTAHPTREWMANVLRFQLSENPVAPNLIIRDRDPSFDGDEIENILKSTGTRFLRCPRRAPKANCFVERLNRTLQEECTDHFLFFSERQLENTLKRYQRYYNEHRPHQGIDRTLGLISVIEY
jgi:putative transposase